MILPALIRRDLIKRHLYLVPNAIVVIKGSFVFGLDHDDKDVFQRTVDWGINHEMVTQNRITTYNCDLYDTRHVVYKTRRLSPSHLEEGYHWAYREFYRWNNILVASRKHHSLKHMMKHFAYTAGWKKFEPLWNLLIKSGMLYEMLPVLESVLSKVKARAQPSGTTATPSSIPTLTTASTY